MAVCLYLVIGFMGKTKIYWNIIFSEYSSISKQSIMSSDCHLLTVNLLNAIKKREIEICGVNG